jgi:hypothetical protein
MTVAEHLESTSREFGQLRYLNCVFNHCVDFGRLSPFRFVSADTWLLNRAALVDEYAELCGLSVADVESLILSNCTKPQSWCLSQGHDTVRILAQGLRNRIGRKQLHEQDVARILRIAFSIELLQQSVMYKSLCAIQERLPARLFT